MTAKIALLLLAVIGAPLFAIIGATALSGFHSQSMDLSLVVMEIFRIVETPVLISIPMFTFAGELMARSHTSTRLVAFSRALMGWMPGGLGVVTLVVCASFTALTGASGVTIIALGALLYPALTSEGYSEQYSLGLVTTSGSLGLLFPPAIPLILYGVIAETSINQLFMAGLIPGLLMLLMLALYCIRRGRKSNIPLQPFSWEELKRSAWVLRYELPLPFLVMGGIYSGIIALSEAAAVTAVYAFVAEVLLYKDVSFKDLADVMRKSMTLVGGILIILAVSQASTNYLIDQQVPQKLFALVSTHVTSKWTFLILLNIFLLALGALLDIFSAIVLVVPLILPIARGYGIDPVHLGIIFLANMEIGYCTPPIGLNLFISSYRFKKPILTVCRSTLPFLAILAAVVALVTFVPELSLTLASLVR